MSIDTDLAGWTGPRQLGADAHRSGMSHLPSRFLVGPRIEQAAIAFGDRNVVDARFPPRHQSGGVELPQLVAIAAEPLAPRVVPFVLEAHGDAVAVVLPNRLLPQHVVEFPCPLGREEGDDLGAPGDEQVAIAPDRILGVRQG